MLMKPRIQHCCSEGMMTKPSHLGFALQWSAHTWGWNPFMLAVS